MVSDRVLLATLRSERAVRIGGDAIRAVVGLLVAIAIAWVVVYQAAMVQFMFTKLNMNDFGKFYYSARYFLDGRDMYGPSPATEIPVGEHETRQFWNMNPPHFHLLMLPLANLTPQAALGVWGIANSIALVLAALLIAAELRFRWTVGGILWLLLAALINASTGAVVVTGQLTFLLLLGLTMAWRAFRREHWLATAMWLGLLASLKPFLGIFGVYLIARRLWGAAAVMVAAGSSAIAAGIAVFGLSQYSSWIQAVRQATWTWPPMNASIGGFFSRSFEDSPLFTPVFVAPSLAQILTLGMSALVLFVTVRALQTADRENLDRAFLLLMLAALLVTPIGWIYYLWLALGPALACWTRHARWTVVRVSLAAIAVVGLLCPLVLTGIWRGYAIATPTIGSAYFWTVFGLWLLAIPNTGFFSGNREPRLRGNLANV